MASAREPASPRAFPTARSYLLLAACFIAFAIYGSLIPFDFERTSPEAAWSQFIDALLTPPSRIPRTDFLANVLLFVPIGFSLAGGFLVDRLSLVRAIAAGLAVLAIGAPVSITAEYLQMFSGGRVPSNLDIAAHGIGCGIGFAAWLVAGDSMTGWLRATWAARSEDRLSRVLVAYTAIWLFVSLAPFDLTVDVGDLGARLRSGAINPIPFRDTGVPPSARVWDALAEVLSAVPLGAAALAGWTQGRARSPAAAFAAGASLVAGVEVAQIFIRSHAADATDAVLGWVGVCVGVVAGGKLLARPARASEPYAAGAFSWRLAILLVVWSIVIAAYHWRPFDFTIDEEGLGRKLARMSLVPFAGYLRGSYLNAMSDLLTKVGLSMPLGVIAAYACSVRTPRAIVTLGWIVAAAGVFAVIEGGQLLLPSRTPDPTDVLVGVVGSLIGLSLGRWIRDR